MPASICPFCMQPVEARRGPKGGRPRVYHPECKELKDALDLLNVRAAAFQGAGRVLPAETSATLRHDLIATAWATFPGRIGKVPRTVGNG